MTTRYYAGRCPLCRRATLHLTPDGKERMEQRGYCDMCKREKFMRPLYHLENIEQRLIQVEQWDAEMPGPMPIMARAHGRPELVTLYRRLYVKRMAQRTTQRRLLAKAGALQDYGPQERAIRTRLHQLVDARMVVADVIKEEITV